jgi:hypothetical protein
LAGAEAATSAAPAVGAEAGVMSAAGPYLGPAGVGFAAGSILPNMLGIKSEAGQVANWQNPRSVASRVVNAQAVQLYSSNLTGII